MKNQKIPMRSCVVSKEKLPKKDLIRVVKTENGVVVDNTGKVNGRGAYLKKDVSIINKAQKTKVLDKHLNAQVSDEIYDELRRNI